VIVDEAYGDFCADPLAAWAPATDRVVVLRTLSKAFGLAGLRVGIAIGPAAVIAEIEKSRGPYKVSVIAEAAGAAALRHDAAWIATSVERATAARRRLAADLTGLGLRVWPSTANFLLVRAPDDDARGFAAALAAAGIGVRPFPGLAGAGDCVRITVGPDDLMDRLLQRIEEVTRS
jgi:histidinol-phosphate aminotransferase